MRVICLTSNAYLHALPGFGYLFNKFWGSQQAVTVVRYEQKPPALPRNFSQFAIGRQSNFTWSSGLRYFLERGLAPGEDYLLLMLEDYYLSAPVAVSAIAAMEELVVASASAPQTIVKLDLSGDRVKFDHTDAGAYASHALVASTPDAPFMTSLQAAIWQKDFLLACLNDSENPWQFEKKGTKRLHRALAAGLSVRLLGLAQPALRYCNAIGGEGSMPNTYAYHRMPHWMAPALRAQGVPL